MSTENNGPPTRGASWTWWVCCLLLLATMVNYMDRLTMNQTSKRVMSEIGFDEAGYGELESAFAYAFALGAILSGWMADRWNVRWVYPAVLLAWSAAGFATGLVQGFFGLLACRFLLGLAEAGHWPCGLRTTRHILPPADRSMGNSILQSGAAVGAILTPLLILALPKGPDTWRYPFLIVGVAGVSWVIFWVASVRSRDLAPGAINPAPPPVGLLLILFGLLACKVATRLWEVSPVVRLSLSLTVSVVGITAVVRWLVASTADDAERDRTTFLRRFGVLLVVVVMINTTWHFFRAWLPLFLQNQHGYSETFMNWFLMFYYLATDAGALLAGFVVLRLGRSGFGVHGSRLAVFAACAGLCSFCGVSAAAAPTGPLLLGLLLLVGFCALGLFPNYYSFSQDLTSRHQGKLTGALGCCCWLAMSPIHEIVGERVKESGSYSLAMAIAALAPLVALAALKLFWGAGRGETVTITEPRGDIAAVKV